MKMNLKHVIFFCLLPVSVAAQTGWSQDEAMEIVGAARIPVSTVRDTRDLYDDPDFERRGLMQAIDHPDADAIFMSCGALRVLTVIDEIEAATGKPVVFSNQANFWQCLRLAGIDDRIAGFGRLLREH